MRSGIVFVVIRHSGRVRGAAGPVEGRYAWVIAAKQGLVVHAIAGSDISEARAAGERLAESKG